MPVNPAPVLGRREQIALHARCMAKHAAKLVHELYCLGREIRGLCRTLFNR
jgi:hypothetical protein